MAVIRLLRDLHVVLRLPGGQQGCREAAILSPTPVQRRGAALAILQILIVVCKVSCAAIGAIGAQKAEGPLNAGLPKQLSPQARSAQSTLGMKP